MAPGGDSAGTVPKPGMAELFESLCHSLPSLGLQRGHLRGFCRNYSGAVRLIHEQSVLSLRALMDVWLPPEGPHCPVPFRLPVQEFVLPSPCPV